MKLHIPILAMMVCCQSANAYTNEEVAKIVISSPELKSAQAARDAETAISGTLNNLSDPEVEFEHQWGLHGIGNKWGFSVKQGFDWPGVYKSRRQAADASRRASASLYDVKVSELTQRVNLLLIDLCYANKEIALLDSIKSSLTSLNEKYATGFQRGETSILDVKKIELELIGINRSYNDAIDRRAEIEGQLRGINPAAEWDGLLATTEYPATGKILTEKEYADALKANNPESRYLADMKSLALKNYEVERRSNFPGFSVGYRHDYELGEKFNGLSVGITLPFFSGRNKAKAASLEVASYGAEMESQDARLNAEWAALRARAIRLEKECREYRHALVSSDSQRLLKMALNGGEISLLTYLQESAYFQQARREYLSVEHQMHTAIAQLNRYVR